MKLKALVLVLIALVLGSSAVYLSQEWIERQIALQSASPSGNIQQVAVSQSKLVVARIPLKFGNKITEESLKVIDWPVDALPPNHFKTIEELVDEEGRVALQAIETNEPILINKVSGPGQRASLSSIIAEGMRAVTIRVNDVLGVGGFILPGDHVDVLLTRKEGDSRDAFATDIIIQNVKVLGIDQESDKNTNQPTVVKAATLEVTAEHSQVLALAAQAGSLSLALRDVANTEILPVSKIDLSDLGKTKGPEKPAVPLAKEVSAPPKVIVKRTVRKKKDSLANIGITRGLEREEYKVDEEKKVETPTLSVPSPKPVVPEQNT